MLILGPEDGAYSTSAAGFILQDKLPLDSVAPGVCDVLPEPQLVELRTANGVRAPEASETKIQLNNVAFPDVDRLQARTAPAPIPALVKTATGLEWLATGIDGNEAELLGGKTNIAGLNRFRARIARIERCQTYLQYLIQEIRKMMQASDHGTADSLFGTVMARPVLFAFQKMSSSAALRAEAAFGRTPMAANSCKARPSAARRSRSKKSSSRSSRTRSSTSSLSYWRRSPCS